MYVKLDDPADQPYIDDLHSIIPYPIDISYKSKLEGKIGSCP